jgi:hypothetical protein
MEKFSKRRSFNKNALLKFKKIYNKHYDIRDIINTGLDGKINEDLRATYWKLYLDILPIDNPEKWIKLLSQERQEYYNKVEKFITNDIGRYINEEIEEIAINKDDLETLSLIKLDVKRTYQEIDLFRNKHVRDILVRVLYTWSKLNSDLSYIQGMNEIAGTLLYALYPANSVGDTLAGDEETSVYYFLNSDESFEADLFSIYSSIMKKGMKSLYNYHDKEKLQIPDTTEYQNISLIDIESSGCSELKKRIKKIFYYYLRIIDKELYIHIYDKVEPYLFLFRWILCLLTRELTNLKNVIYIWDCIFAFEKINQSSSGIGFVDSVCLAMICSVRDELLAEEDGCFMLQTLMHFPNESSIKDITKQAMIIRELINEHLNQISCKLYY